MYPVAELKSQAHLLGPLTLRSLCPPMISTHCSSEPGKGQGGNLGTLASSSLLLLSEAACGL